MVPILKAGVALLADTTAHEDMARTVNAHVTGKEFKEAGAGGQGHLRWRRYEEGQELDEPGNRVHPL